MIISLDDYWMGRDKQYPLTDEIRANATSLLIRVSALLTRMEGMTFELHPRTGTIVSSGWRPPSVNARTNGAAAKSLHMIGMAIDLYDPDGEIDEWCFSHLDVLALPEIDLYMEHPSQSSGWSHLQSAPPRSQARLQPSARRRWFYK